MTVLLGVVLGLVTMLAWVSSDVFSKLTFKHASFRTIISFSQIMGGTLVLIFGFMLGLLTFTYSTAWFFIVGLAILNFLGMETYYRAIHEKGLALASPLVDSWALVAIFLGVVFFGERLSSGQWLAAALIIGGIYIVTIPSLKKITLDAGYTAAFISTIVWGVFFVMLKVPNAILGVVTVVMSVKLLTGFIVLPGAEIKKYPLSIWGAFLLIAIFEAIGFLTFNYGITVAPISIIAPVSSTAPALSVLTGMLFFKEKVTKRQLLGVIVIILGIVLIAL